MAPQLPSTAADAVDPAPTAAPSDDPARWRAVAADALAWREWDGEFVVFNALTGDTHLLDVLGIAALWALQEMPPGASTDALQAHLLADWADESISLADPATVAARLPATLSALRQLGLIDALPA